MARREHSAYHESKFSPAEDISNSQRHLSDKAVNVYAIRHPRVTTPGESRTSPTLDSAFMSGDPLDEDNMKWYIPPLAEANVNPQDAVNRTVHPAGGGGMGGFSHTMRKLPAGMGVNQRIVGAGGTNAQQTRQRQFELNPVSHPMAGGAVPAHINLRQTHERGDIPYFPMASGQIAPVDPRVTPKNNRNYKTFNARQTLDNRPHIHNNKQVTATQRSNQRGI